MNTYRRYEMKMNKVLKAVLVAAVSFGMIFGSVPTNVFAVEIEAVKYSLDSLNSSSLWNWQVKMEEQTGLPKVLYGSITNQYQETPQDISRRFLFEYPELAGMGNSSIDYSMAETINMLGTYILYVETYNGIPIEQSYLLFSITHDNRISLVKSKIFSPLETNTNPQLSDIEAYNIALEDALKDTSVEEPGDVTLVLVSQETGTIPAWRVHFKTDDFGGELIYLVNDTGAVIEKIQKQGHTEPNLLTDKEDVVMVLNSLNNPDVINEAKGLIDIISRVAPQDDYRDIVAEAIVTADLNVTGRKNLSQIDEILKNSNFLPVENPVEITREAVIECPAEIETALGDIKDDLQNAWEAVTNPTETPLPQPTEYPAEYPAQIEDQLAGIADDLETAMDGITEVTEGSVEKPTETIIDESKDSSLENPFELLPQPIPETSVEEVINDVKPEALVELLPPPLSEAEAEAQAMAEETIDAILYNSPITEVSGPIPSSYIVQPGDTLENISLYFGMDSSTILSINNTGGIWDGMILNMKFGQDQYPMDTLENALSSLAGAQTAIYVEQNQLADVETRLNNAMNYGDYTQVSAIEHEFDMQKIAVTAAYSAYSEMQKHVDAIREYLMYQQSLQTSTEYPQEQIEQITTNITSTQHDTSTTVIQDFGSDTSSVESAVIGITDAASYGINIATYPGSAATGSITGYNTDDGAGATGSITASTDGGAGATGSITASTDTGLSGGSGEEGGTGSGSGSSADSSQLYEMLNMYEMLSNLTADMHDMSMSPVRELESLDLSTMDVIYYSENQVMVRYSMDSFQLFDVITSITWDSHNDSMSTIQYLDSGTISTTEGTGATGSLSGYDSSSYDGALATGSISG